MDTLTDLPDHAPSSYPWFAVKVRARSEPVAVQALRDKGYDPFFPIYPNRRSYCDRIKTVNTPLFPGYVFCRFDPVHHLSVLRSPAVSCIVGFGGRLTPIPETEIEAVRLAVNAGAHPVPYLKVGQRVRILQGSLAGLEGVLIRSSDSLRVVMSIDMLQRSIAVHVNASDLTVV